MKRGGSNWISCLALAALCASAFADETRVIQLRHRSAAEMIPVVQPLLGPADALSGTDYRLIVRTSDKNFREIEKLLTQLDTTRRQLRISVRQTAAERRTESGVGVSGEVRNDNVRIQVPRQGPPDDRGLVIRRDGVQLETRQTRTTSNSSVSSFVSTLEGSPAFIRVGQSITHVHQVLTLTGKQQLVLAQGISLHDVVTGFDVTPHMQGENVQLRITPRLSKLSNPTISLVSFQELSTTVVVKPGEWVDIGGLSGNGREVRRAILDSSSTQTGEQRTVLVKVE